MTHPRPRAETPVPDDAPPRPAEDADAARRAAVRAAALALLERLRDLDALRRARTEAAGDDALGATMAGGNARLVAEVTAAAARLAPDAYPPAAARDVERTAFLLESLARTVGALEALLARQ